MGKPRRSIMKVKQKLKKKTGVGQMHHDADELMKDASSQLHKELKIDIQTCSTPTQVVFEDIKIHPQILNSKVSKKKEKRKLKRDSLLAKLQSSDDARIKKRRAKERASAVIVGDMQPLLNALPDLPVVANKSTTEKLSGREKRKNWNDKKWKSKKREELQDMDLFKKVLQLPEYKKDPVCAIASHVEYMVKGDLL